MTDTSVTTETKAEHGPATIVDLDAGPAEWEIAPGHTVEGFTFNGSVPGPTIEARVGEEIVIRLKNGLPEPTVVHGTACGSRRRWTEPILSSGW
jgi:FtsP/CotA-like multicopper oxidase with cupredoxin domain